jgi:hypothetical protein
MSFLRRSTGTPNWDEPDSHEWEPFTTTKEDGSFLFLYATPGTWEFRTRHPDSPVPAPPVLVRATGHGRTIQQDLHLGTATIRGQLDTDSLAEDRKKVLTAYLFRLERSHTDPFYAPHHGSAQSWDMMNLEVGPSGAFEFPYLPEGDWVLRLVSRRDDIILQRQLHSDRNIAIDLGRLEPPKTVDAEVLIALPGVDPGSEVQYMRQSFGLWIRKPIAGREQGIFARTIRVTEGAVELGALEPGEYEIDLFSGYSGMSLGFSGKSIGEIRTLTVGPDGTVEPAKLQY